MNKTLLNLEGGFVLLLSIVFYSMNEFSWLLFGVLFFLPDLAMVGYAVNNKYGAFFYNLFHTYTITLLFELIGLLLEQGYLTAVGLIWSAHIGMDRAIGYGLKYKSGFKGTHLQQV